MNTSSQYHFCAILAQSMRADVYLATLFPAYSRSLLSAWIQTGALSVNQVTVDKPRFKICNTDRIVLSLQDQTDQSSWTPQAIPLDIIFQDSDIIVINKSTDLTVHPGAGQHSNTLANALLYHFPELAQLPRAGIIHRLDKDTSGLMVIARTHTAHFALIQQLQARTVKRIYHAITHGNIIAGRTIETNIGRDPKRRTAMAVVERGKPALTHFRVLDKFIGYTLVEVHLETGRTHQIRVHMAYIKHPLIGDKTYGKTGYKTSCDALKHALTQRTHQALHATKLCFIHPKTNEEVSFSAPYPADFDTTLNALRRWACPI